MARVHASNMSSKLYIGGFPAGDVTLIKYDGRGMDKARARLRSSSWSGPAIGKPTFDSIRASMANWMASGPDLPDSCVLGKNLAITSVR